MVNGGFPLGPDGRVHTIFTHNPSSLRLSSHDPNLQNIPRGVGSEVERWVKECFVAPEGNLFWARDYSGIEAVLVGYFCGSRRVVYMAKLGLHAYLASHILGRPADLGWSAEDLRAYFAEIKKDKATYDTAKRVVHASNYMVSPVKLVHEFPDVFPTQKVARTLQELYFDLFPEIRAWHKDLCLRVDGTKQRKRNGVEEKVDPWTMGVCFVQNPFGYVHRFYNVVDWIKDKEKNEWLWEFGEDAKRLISFLPQSTAAAILKRASKRIWYNHPSVGSTMRLLIHDEILGEVREAGLDECLAVSRRIMEEPIPELPLDPSWGMGEFLTIGTEAKVGNVWANMKGVKE